MTDQSVMLPNIGTPVMAISDMAEPAHEPLFAGELIHAAVTAEN